MVKLVLEYNHKDKKKAIIEDDDTITCKDGKDNANKNVSNIKEAIKWLKDKKKEK